MNAPLDLSLPRGAAGERGSLRRNLIISTMELGHCSFRRDGINTLSRALHPKHGLAWTDGQGIYLCPMPFHAFDDSLQNTASSVRLGTFESVSSLQWSADIETERNINSCQSQPQYFCYLCVVHSNNVSIWSVLGQSPDLSLKHVRKINCDPIPQGSLWNPQRDILCLLKPSQCCFYFRHASNKGSYSFPVIDSGRITCGCWSKDGKRLVIGVGEIILVYQWNDIDKSISEYHITAWKIPNIDGSIRSLVSISDHQMACTTELPLDQLCKAQSANLFDFPGPAEINSSSDSDSLRCAWDNSSESDPEIVCKPHNSHVDTLFNLKRNAQTLISTASSQLLAFAIPKSGLEPPSKMACEPLPGLLVPDVLHYDSSLGVILVGSNTQSSLLVYKQQRHQLLKLQKINLGENHRLKGLCSLPGTAVEGVLATVGKQAPQNFAFLSPSLNVDYDLSLHVIPLNKSQADDLPASPSKPNPLRRRSAADIPANLFKEIQLPNRNSRVHLLRFNTQYTDQHFIQDHEMKPEKTSSNAEFNLLLPGNNIKDIIHASKPLIIDGAADGKRTPLQVEKTEFSACKPDFENNVNHFAQSFSNGCYESITACKAVDASYRSGNDLSSGSVKVEAEPSLLEEGVCVNEPQAQSPQVTAVEHQIQQQGSQIGQLQRRIDEIACLLDETVQSDYKPAHDPDVVYLVYRDMNDSDVDAVESKKAFVLDKNRLQLDAVKMTFGLATVELFVGEVPCVLSANAVGYIALIFKRNETYFITGQRSVNTASTYC